MLLTWHNLHYYQELMQGLRGAIEAGTLQDFIAAFPSTALGRRRGMKSNIRMIATDLDGTLLRHDGTLSERTIAAFRAAAAAGLTITLASGRPPRSVLPIAQQLGVDGLAVCSNGAIVYDLERGAVLHNEAVPRAALTEIINAMRGPGAQRQFCDRARKPDRPRAGFPPSSARRSRAIPRGWVTPMRCAPTMS